jgi:asparagine synthetase B (glutamine-hydrolysing)
MCGIFGWIKPKATISTDLDLAKIFRNGLVASQERGEDATGFYTTSSGVVKDAICAEEFVDDLVPDNISESRFAIGHVRWASAKYGTENRTNPHNAQPLESSSFVLAHNGTITTPRIKSFKFTSDIDSESILALADKNGVRSALSSVDGDSAVVLYSKKQKKLFFWTNGGRPLSICLYRDIIFFASTRKILQSVLKPKTQLLVFTPDIAFATLYEHELLEYDLSKNCFIRRGEIKQKVSTVTSTTVHSQVVSSHFNPVNYKDPIGIKTRKPLPRGCTSNPSSNSRNAQSSITHDYPTQLVLPAPKDFVDDEQYGRQAREKALDSGVTKIIRLGKDGQKLISYDTTKRFNGKN